MIKILKPLIAIAIGMLTTLAFAPYHLSPVAVICPALLLLLWQNTTNKQGALIGFGYGFGLYVTGTWWVYLSMQNFGHMAPPLAIFATVLLACYSAMYFGFMGWLVCRFSLPDS